MQESNPVDPTVAYAGRASDFGTLSDPMIGQRVGGVNVFGGGLTLYGITGAKIGAIGVSGDASRTDHVVAYKVRAHYQNGVTLSRTVPGSLDVMIQDIVPDPVTGAGVSTSGFGHPTCLNNPSPAQSQGSIR